MHPSQRQQVIIERRQRLAALRLAGVRDQRALARALNCSQPTVCRDCKALDAAWQREAAACIAREKALDLQRIERLIQAMWPEALTGNHLKVDRLILLLDRKAKLLGLD